MSRTFVFHGIVSYGVRVVCADSPEEAAKIAQVPYANCQSWPGKFPRRRGVRYEIQEVEPGDYYDYGE